MYNDTSSKRLSQFIETTMLKKLLVIGFCISLMSCNDDSVVNPLDVKQTIASELKNTVWTPTYAASNESGTHVREDVSKAYFSKVKFVDDVVELTARSGGVVRYGYDITNADNATSIPDPLQITVKTNYANLIFTVPRNYSDMEMYLKIKEDAPLFYEARYQK